MLKLYGFPSSNYVNMVQLALLEKGVPFEFVLTYPGQSPEFLAKSPRGKVPYLETPSGYLNESSVLLDYIEEATDGVPLLPKDPGEKARVRALMKQLELYIELPARSCYPEALFGAKCSEAIKVKARDELLSGFAALKRQAKFSPYLAGDSFTMADIVFLYSVELGVSVAKKLFGIDLLDGFPEASDLLQRLSGRPHVQSIAAQRAVEWPKFIAAVQAKYQVR
ncbi:glutathione S-transferase [Duganella sp. FT3S]|uniref:Glutathione S-transferase n=1 Tax=Rugamonas fusca TaxID=2758568 RepID=A0A7W2I5C4_9BURK|nr:glutathione S-transferase [Rugamonas fusca]MBA5604249.1 glutathione S-transferase [Rugamonas fusca]